MGAMQRNGGSFAIFAKLVVAALNAYQDPATRLESCHDLFGIHGEFISKKIGFEEFSRR